MAGAPRSSAPAGARTWLTAALVAALVAAVFAPAVRNGFVNWDDQVNITGNPHFRGFAPANLKWMLTAAVLGHYIPLTWLTLALDHAVWGMDPRGYHLTNVLLHAANAALVFLVARRLLAGYPVAAVVAALTFGLHPLRAESVAWVTERRDVLSGLLVLLALLAYLRATESAGAARRGWLGASLGAFAASLLAKAITMTFPVVLLILDWYPLRRRALREKVPFAAVGAVGAAVALAAVRTTAVTSWADYGAPARFAMTTFSLAFYVSRTLVPVGLSPLYELPAVVHPLAREFVLSTAATVGLTAAAIGVRRRAPWFTAAWAAYAVVLLPVAGPVHAGLQLAHDRYSYLSCLPWALLAGAGVGSLMRAGRQGVAGRAVGVAAGAVVVATIGGWSYLTVQQVRIWRSSEALWGAAIDADPACSACRASLGKAFLDAGRLDAAEGQLRAAIALRPERASPHNTLGAVLYREGRYAEAAGEWRLAARLRPGFAEPINNLGVLQARLGRLDEAVWSFEAALRLKPDYSEARENLTHALSVTAPSAPGAPERILRP